MCCWIMKENLYETRSLMERIIFANNDANNEPRLYTINYPGTHYIRTP